MAKIIISELHLADSESYLTEITNIDDISVYGGNDPAFSQVINFATKLLDFVLLAYGIYSITLLAKSFNAAETQSNSVPLISF